MSDQPTVDDRHIRAYAIWPFQRNRIGVQWRAPGDLVEVWFAPTDLIERDGVYMVRVHDPDLPLFAWWVPVEQIELDAGEPVDDVEAVAPGDGV